MSTMADAYNQSVVSDVLRTDEPAYSPLWWTYTLERDLGRRSPLVSFYEDEFDGRFKLAFATAKFREAFAEMLAAVSDNWLPMVVNASVERLRVQGFSTGADQEETVLSDGWRIWQENHLDLDQALLYREASKHGEAYLLSWWDQKQQGKGIFGRFFSRSSSQPQARITVEHPSQMIVAREPGDRRRRAAALKKWKEEDGTLMATLYLPDSIYRWQREDKPDSRWAPRRGVTADEKNPLGVVPVIPVVNEPHMMPCYPPSALLQRPHSVPKVAVGLGRSDMADVITTVDQINKLLCDMMVASEIGGFRQRYALGLEVDNDEATGKPKAPFEHAINRLWINPNAEGKFGEFGQTDLNNFIIAIDNRVQSLCARTRTPPHYVLGKIANASGDALKAAETGLVCKTKDKKTSYSESIKEAVGIGLAIEESDQADQATSMEVGWAQIESRSESEYVDSLVKKLSIGVPKEQLWEDAGYSEQQIKDFKRMLQEEAAAMGVFNLNTPDIPPPGPQPPTPPPVPANGG